MRLDGYFDKIWVINLEERRDRRREMEAELAKAGLRAEFFPAVKPTEQEDWPNLGAKGCFLSHYNVLKLSLDAGLKNALVLEDDLDFSPGLMAMEKAVLTQMDEVGWDIVYFGHLIDFAAGGPTVRLLDSDKEVRTAYFYGVHHTVLPRVVDFLEQVSSRPDGHPLGGRQHVDGAFSMFREQNPDIRTLIAVPVMGTQRSSKSDITSSVYDNVPVVANLASVARRLRRRLTR